MSQTGTTILVPPSPQTPDDPIFLRDGFFIAVLAVRLCSLLDRPRVRRPRHLRPSRGRAGVRGHIPTQRNRRIACSVDPVRYRRHNRVELFFNKLNHFRRIATSFENSRETSLVQCVSLQPATGPGLIGRRPRPCLLPKCVTNMLCRRSPKGNLWRRLIYLQQIRIFLGNAARGVSGNITGQVND